jgi:hypothetical protein
LSDILLAKIFSHSVDCFSNLVTIFFIVLISILYSFLSSAFVCACYNSLSSILDTWLTNFYIFSFSN